MEFTDNDNLVFTQIVKMLEKYSKFQKYEILRHSPLLLSGLEIYPEQRKVYYAQKEICLTAKEYDLLYLLAVNKECVLTYEQIYEKVWGEISSGDEKNTVGFHIHNLRQKLNKAIPKAPFTIQCVREVGYCLEVN